jgi:SAM-dependent MidA family methyltransferase
MQAWAQDLIVHGPTTQRAFLQGLGIDVRAQRLMAGATAAQKKDIESGLKRLTDASQMGELFKVIALCDDPQLAVEGFDESL